MDKFVRVKAASTGEIWLNIANIVAIKEVNNVLEIHTNEVRDGNAKRYSVKGSLSEFFETVGVKPLSFE